MFKHQAAAERRIRAALPMLEHMQAERRDTARFIGPAQVLEQALAAVYAFRRAERVVRNEANSLSPAGRAVPEEANSAPPHAAIGWNKANTVEEGAVVLPRFPTHLAVHIEANASSRLPPSGLASPPHGTNPTRRRPVRAQRYAR